MQSTLLTDGLETSKHHYLRIMTHQYHYASIAAFATSHSLTSLAPHHLRPPAVPLPMCVHTHYCGCVASSYAIFHLGVPPCSHLVLSPLFLASLSLLDLGLTGSLMDSVLWVDCGLFSNAVVPGAMPWLIHVSGFKCNHRSVSSTLRHSFIRSFY